MEQNGGVGKASEQKPKPNPWPGIAFLMCLMVCATAVTIVYMVWGG